MKDHDCLYRLIGRCSCYRESDKPFCNDFMPAWLSGGNVVTYVPELAEVMKKGDQERCKIQQKALDLQTSGV